MLEPAQLVDVPLVEAVEGDVAEERVAGALRGQRDGCVDAWLKPKLSKGAIYK